MYFNDHNPPHFHAKYSGYEALFSFDGQIIEGEPLNYIAPLE
ncbi:transcriptional regulator [Catenovulum agarivorans DS-2]|uniref:Transcriptional regulator n=2 Tax=Catenovulum agarivorans TaxID=1172192 RepID=W7QAI4_9ALTE|nr:transcriptional regulator [Catenovulum agarivorans DS-2]